uniref:Melanopsin-like n=1 Tax=Saccoglossus kowalevskii TaxID=10224 RepID=A0ABM0LV34_SACKO|nr:PREDICTED: melanopsin-like [Saccoglossus kowalevskii]
MKRACMLVPVTWIYSAICALPPVFGWGTYFSGELVPCSFGNRASRSYQLYVLFLTFMLPISLMTMFYYQIYKTILHHSRLMNSGAVGKTKLLKVEQKTNVLMLAVLITFCLSWFPFHVVAICRSFLRAAVAPALVSVSVLLACSSPVINFFLYVVANRSFYKCISRIAYCCKNQQSPRAETQQPVQDVHTHDRITHNPAAIAPTDLQIPNVLLTVSRDTDADVELSQIAEERRKSTIMSPNPNELEVEIQQRRRSAHRLSVIMLGDLPVDHHFLDSGYSNQVLQDTWSSPSKHLECVGESAEGVDASPTASFNGSPYLTVVSEGRRKTIAGVGIRRKVNKNGLRLSGRNTVTATHAMGRKKKRRGQKVSPNISDGQRGESDHNVRELSTEISEHNDESAGRFNIVNT